MHKRARAQSKNAHARSSVKNVYSCIGTVRKRSEGDEEESISKNIKLQPSSNSEKELMENENSLKASKR